MLNMIPPNPYRVLVVDDDSVQRKLCREILDGPEFRVTEAGSGAEALRQLETHEFDVMLVDKRMPDLDGEAVCKHVRLTMARDLLPIILITGSGGSEDLVSGMRAGATDFVRKPYPPAELVARVQTAASRKRLTDQLDSAESMLFALARMVEARDEDTGDHCGRLMHTAAVYGAHLKLAPEQMLALRRGGVLHDIGKLGIPDNILLKRGPLTEAEWVVMRSHTVIGARLVSGLQSMKLTAPIIRCHHERWDGSGYPDGLHGEEIPLLARIFQILDIYDALTYVRPYKPALPHEEALRIMCEEAAQGWRDPQLMHEFIALAQRSGDELVMPIQLRKTEDERIYDDVVATGILSARRRLTAV